MVKFKIRSYGTGRRSSKAWLNDACQHLPSIFSFSDIKSGGYFSASITHKLSRAKKHNSIISLRKGRRYHVYIQVINKKDSVVTNQKLNKMKKLALKLSKSKDVIEYFNIVRKIKLLDNKYRGPHEGF